MSGRRQRAERRGRLAESLAALWLRLKGYRILERRFRTAAGEIDLIARRGRSIAFVEVKARRDLATGLEAVTSRQRKRSTRAMLAYLMRHPGIGMLDLRLDVIVIRPWAPPRHIAGAWRPDETGLR